MRRAMFGVAGAAALAAIGSGAALMADDGFDSAGWKQVRGSTARDNPRSAMVPALKTKLKPGMARAEVVDLLGQPETEKGGRLTYNLGVSTYGIDYEYYVIELDGDRVKSFGMRRG